MSSQARHTYLQWSVAHYFMVFHGPPKEDWIIAKSELFEAGPVYLRVAEPRHDWSAAREAWAGRKQERAALSILRTLHIWRSRDRHRQEEREAEGERVWLSSEAVAAAAASGETEVAASLAAPVAPEV